MPITRYTRQADFTDWSADHPGEPHQGTAMDAEFDAVKTATDAIRSAIGDVRRDDGALKNEIVTPDSLSSGTKALISGFTIRGPWVATTFYLVADFVTQGGDGYICIVAHTADTFATDLAAGKWLLFHGTPAGLGVSDFAKTLLDDFDAAAARATLGSTTVGDALFTAATADAARATLGGTAVGKALFTAATADAARATLGSTTVGDAVFTAATAAAARATLGSTTVGDAVFTAATADAALTTLGGTAVGKALFTADSAAGLVELATIAETLAGTDTARAVTSRDTAALWRQGADLTVAETLVAPTDANKGGYYVLNGTGEVSALWTPGGPAITIVCASAGVVWKPSATLALPGGAAITSQAGDVLRLQPESWGWRCASYSRADGAAVKTGNQASLSSSGYVKFADGMIMQWGYVAAGTEDVTVPFPLAFPTACCAITANCIKDGINATFSCTINPSISKTSFSCHKRYWLPGEGVGGAAEPFYWHAVGY